MTAQEIAAEALPHHSYACLRDDDECSCLLAARRAELAARIEAYAKQRYEDGFRAAAVAK